MTQIKGIDVSHWQGNIDWKKVANDGVKFAIIKASEGHSYVDAKFKVNVEGANEAGIKTGAYHYAKFSSVAEAIVEAKHFLATVAGLTLTYPLVLDLEEDKKKVGKKVLTDAALAFLKVLTEAKRSVILYSGKSFLENNLDETKFKDYPLWIARYNSVLGRSAEIWQYTSSGIVNGIAGKVDMNWAYREFSPMIKPDKKYRLVTGTFSNKEQAENAAAKLRRENGWLVYLKEE